MGVKNIIRPEALLLFSRILTGDGTAGWCGMWWAACCRSWLERQILIMIMQKADWDKNISLIILQMIIGKLWRSTTFRTVFSVSSVLCQGFWVTGYNLVIILISIFYNFKQSVYYYLFIILLLVYKEYISTGQWLHAVYKLSHLGQAFLEPPLLLCWNNGSNWTCKDKPSLRGYCGTGKTNLCRQFTWQPGEQGRMIQVNTNYLMKSFKTDMAILSEEAEDKHLC